MIKKSKNILIYAAAAFSAPIVTLLSAKCGATANKEDKNSVEIKPLANTDFEKLINGTTDINKLVTFEFNSNFGVKKPLNMVLPTELHENRNGLELKVKKEYANKIKVTLDNTKIEGNGAFYPSNSKGEINIFLTFTNLSTNKTIAKEFVLSGLNKNNGLHHTGQIRTNPDAYFGDSATRDKYLAWNQEERFKFDNEKYIQSLKAGQWNNEDPIKNRKLAATESDIKKFNEEAKKHHFDNYYNAALKGFTLPVYKNGKVDGLSVYDKTEIGKGPSSIDALGGRDINKINGLARTLPNEHYKDIALQTFQVSFNVQKDFKAEIARANKIIEDAKSWTEEQLKDFRDKEIRQLTLNYESELELIHAEFRVSSAAKNSLDEAYKKKLKDAQDRFNDFKNKLSKFSADDIKKWQEEEIKKFQEKAKEGRTYQKVSGTMWIMDFEIANSGKKATKFYFGTNSHVAKGLTGKLTGFSLTRINENVGVGKTFRLNGLDDNFTNFTFSVNSGTDVNTNGAIEKVFDAVDFMKEENQPRNLLVGEQKNNFKDVGHYADFAVIGIDFSKFTLENLSITSGGTSIKDTDKFKGKSMDDIAAIITNNYQSNTEKHIKFKSDSYLEKYETIDRLLKYDKNNPSDKEKMDKVDSLYILGYPTAKDDYFLERYKDDDQMSVAKNDFSLWINSEYKYYNKLTTQEGQQPSFAGDDLSKGNYLSYELGYRSFTNKPGLTDGFLAASRIGDSLYETNGKKYFNFGLQLMPRFYAPSGGASGSSVRNQNNELIGVFYGANNTAKTGLAVLFRSPGYNYGNLFGGKYKLPQYDLIYGGGEGQEKSYREELQKKNRDIKTNLFPNGLDKYDEKFKFNNNKTTSK